MYWNRSDNVCSLHCVDTMSSFEKLVSYVDAVPLASTVLVEEHCCDPSLMDDVFISSTKKL